MLREGQVGVLSQDVRAGRGGKPTAVLPWTTEWLESTTELTGSGGKCMSPWKMMDESSRVLYLQVHDD